MRVIILGVVAFLCVSVCSCGTNVDLLPNQRDAITKYLERQSLEYTRQDGVYKCIVNRDRDDYESAAMANPGDSVMYRFEAYTFTSEPGILFYTNKPAMIDTLANHGLNPEFWPREPVKIKVGVTNMMKGLASGIPYCREGDSVLLFMTSDMAYDDKPIGIIQSNTAIMYILNIDNVKK